MTVTFRLHGRCPVCGYRNQGIDVIQVRVNKHTLRGLGKGIMGTPRNCDECDHPLHPHLFDIAALDPQDAQRVQAYRRRRGWAT